MSKRPEKKSMIQEVREHLDASSYAILADCRGLNVTKLALLRGKLRAVNSRLMVVKNTFVGVAASELGWDDAEFMLKGPTAMVTGEGDVSAVAKVLKDFARDNERPSLKGGRFGTRTLSADEVVAIASIPPREVLLAQVVGTIAAPMTQLVGVMNQKVLSLLYVLKAVADKKSQNE